MGGVLTYFSELRRAMAVLAEDERVVFVGQSVAYGGQRAHETFADVPARRRIEMPIAEDFQVGFCAGLALAGWVPLCFVPRWDFLLIAANQIVNHLDVLPSMGWEPRVIIRTAVGASAPLDPGPQHTKDCTEAFRLMLRRVEVVSLDREEDVVQAYASALRRDGSTILVESMSRY